MAAERPKFDYPSWKQSSPGAPPSRKRSLARWRREFRTTGGRTRTLKIAFGVVSSLICLSLLLWVSLWLWFPQPTRWVLIGAIYEENLAVPLNVCGWEGLKGLAELVQAPSDSRPVHGKSDPVVTRTLDVPEEWDSELNALSEKTLVLVLALHGGADEKGPYLLADSSDPFTPDFDETAGEHQLLRITRVLERLKKLPASKQKVLILDATQVAADWSLGMLFNDFAVRLRELDSQISAIPNLVVISSSDVGQRSWSADEWRQTAFTHFLMDGLRKKTASDHGRIPLLTLFQGVRDQVQVWASKNRQAMQTPVLLPLGKEGERRAELIELARVTGKDARPAVEIPEMPHDLLLEWERLARLQHHSPPPAVYAPQLWSQYVANLLRLEQLVRAGRGDSNTVAGWIVRLRRLEEAIGNAQALGLPSSTEGALSMPVLDGRSLVLADGWRRVLSESFNQIWSAENVEKAETLWDTFHAKNAANPSERAYDRVQILDMVLERAANDPLANLEKAHTLVRDVLDPLARPQPAEVHYLAMLDRDRHKSTASPPDYGDRLGRALRIRRLAERAALALDEHDRGDENYGYSEQVLPWLGSRIRKADQERRLGEDLLLANDAPSWQRSDAHFDKAKALYDEALKRALSVRSALALRDRALPILPYYSRWSAQRYGVDVDLAEDLEDLWGKLHKLIVTLRTPNPEFRLDEIDTQVGAIRTSLDSVEQRFVGIIDSIGDVDSADAWHETNAAIQIPFSDPDRRTRVWNNLRRIGYRLLSTDARPLKNDETGELPEQIVPNWSEQRANRQGRMAIAVLGKPWFDRGGSDVPNNFAQTQDQLNSFERKEIAKASEQIGRKWRARVATVNQLVAKGLREKIEMARADLGVADEVTRQLDAAASIHLDDDPPRRFRRTLVRDLLLEQAERTFADQWYAENPEAEPYYRQAGLAYLSDADGLDVRQPTYRESLREVRERFLDPLPLEISGPARFVATSEQQIELGYHMERYSGSAPPPGFPIVWIDAGEDLDLRVPVLSHRIVVDMSDRRSETVRCRLVSPLLGRAETKAPGNARVEDSTVTVRGLYRGRQLTHVTEVDLHPVPEIVVAHHPPALPGALAIHADPDLFQRYGESSGTVVIVVDCSGSMAPLDNANPAAHSGFHDAKRALERLLHGVARGTRVSIWVFGQNLGQNEPASDAEKTITRLQAPVVWDPVRDPAQLRRIMMHMDALRPWNETPLVRAMLRAKQEDLDTAPNGFKTLIAITDGADNRFAKDAVWNKAKKPISAVLREQFFDSGIEVNVIGYGLVGSDKSEIHKQFDVIEHLPTPGRIVTVDESASLAAELERALKRRLRFWVERDNHVPVEGSENGLVVGRRGANERWFAPIAPGRYNVRVTVDGRVRQPIELTASDRLILSIVENPRGLGFERRLFTGDTPAIFGPIVRRGWSAAVMQNQLVEGRELRMLVTMEKQYERNELPLRQFEPRETWIELGTRTRVQQPVVVRWGSHDSLPAPAWNLTVTQWPKAQDSQDFAQPVPRIWWDPEHPAEACAVFESGVDFTIDVAPPAERTKSLKTGSVVLEGVQIENHLVEVSPGHRESRSCLAVRAAYPAGEPVIIRPKGLTPDGWEHRIYTAAGKYTGLFWSVNADRAKALLTELEVISLNEFKASCERNGHVLALDGLRSPEAGSFAPLELNSDDALPLPIPGDESNSPSWKRR